MSGSPPSGAPPGFRDTNGQGGAYADTDDVYRPGIREFGHEYHWSNRLLIPHDPHELGYQHYQHELFRLCLGGRLTMCRFPSQANRGPFDMLDVGTGSGTWAVEMANTYVNAQVIGIDLTASLFPRLINLPDNVRFEVRDATGPWPRRTYDFIHMRDLAGGGIHDWVDVLEKAFVHLKPGGQLEFAQLACYLSQAPRPRTNGILGPWSAEHRARFMQSCQSQYENFNPGALVMDHLSHKSGVRLITEDVIYLPTRTESFDLSEIRKAAMVQRILPLLLENRSLMLFHRSGIPESYTRALIQEIMRELACPRYDAALKLTIITATKADANFEFVEID